MNTLRILILCISAAFVCTSLRTAHPQIASAVALAAGAAALMLSTQEIRVLTDALAVLEEHANAESGTQLLKLCGIAMIAEFASDICRDAGEVSLAHRIDVGVKIGIVVTALPTVAQIMERISQFIM